MGAIVKCGNVRWLNMDQHPEVKRLLSRNLTVLGLTVFDAPIAVFGLSLVLRPGVTALIRDLEARGIYTSILSGDDELPVKLVATTLGITSFRARCSPEDKKVYVENLVRAGQKVLFIGDGTNDGPALATATIGMSIPSGGPADVLVPQDKCQASVAEGAADVVLLRPDLIAITTLLDLSQASYGRVVAGLAWSLVYNIVAMALAAGAFVNVRIKPEYAAIGETISVLPVIAIALTLRLWER
jgi:cation transport ATPase